MDDLPHCEAASRISFGAQRETASQLSVGLQRACDQLEFARQTSTLPNDRFVHVLEVRQLAAVFQK